MRKRAFFCLIFLITILFGCMPFNFLSKNDVVLLSSERMLSFHDEYEDGSSPKRGTAFTIDSLELEATSEITVKMRLHADRYFGMFGVLLELDDGAERSPLVLGRWKNELIVRSRRVEDERGYHEIGIGAVFGRDEPVDIQIVSSVSGSEVYVNGELQDTIEWFSVIDPFGKFSGRLVFGIGADGSYPYLGAIGDFALYDVKLTPEESESDLAKPLIRYEFSELNEGIVRNQSNERLALHVGERYEPVRRRLLAFPVYNDSIRMAFIRDVVINLIGFIPIAICLAALAGAWTSKWPLSFILGVTLSILLSLTIEVSQAYLPTRDSSVLDWILNSVGGVIGGVLVLGVRLLKRI